MNLSDIRKQYPQYDKVSDDDLAKALHKKFYSHVEFNTFADKIGYSADQGVKVEPPDTQAQQALEAQYGVIRQPDKSGILQEAGRGLKRGFYGAQETLGTALDVLGADNLGQGIADESRKQQSINRMDADISGNVINDPSLLASPRWLAGGVGELAPSIATAALPGGMAGNLARAAGKSAKFAKYAGNITAGAAGGSMEGAGTYRTALDKGDSEGVALAKGATMAAVSAALNSLSFGKMLSGKTKNKLLHAVTAGLTEGATEQAEEPLDAFLNNEDPVEAWLNGFNVFFPSMILGAAGGAGGKYVLDENERAELETALDAALKDRSIRGGEKVVARNMLNVLHNIGQQKWDAAERDAAVMDDAIHAEARQEDAASKLRERLMREQAEGYSGNELLQNLASMNDKQLLEWWDATERESRTQRDSANAEARSDINGQRLKEKLTGLEQLSRQIFGDDQMPALPKPDTIYAEAESGQVTTPEQLAARKRYQEQAGRLNNGPAALPKPEVIYLGPLDIPAQEQPGQGEQPRPDAAVSQEADNVSSGFQNTKQISEADHIKAYQYANAILKNTEKATDAYAYALKTFDPQRGESFPAYTYMVAKYFKTGRRPTNGDKVVANSVSMNNPARGMDSETEIGDILPANNIGENGIIDKLDADMVRTAMRGISPRQAQAIDLVYFQDKTPQSAGEEMGVSRQAVERLIKDGIAELQGYFRQQNSIAAGNRVSGSMAKTPEVPRKAAPAVKQVEKPAAKLENPSKLTKEPGLSKSSLAPSVGTAKTSDVEDISDVPTTSNEFKQFMSDYGMTLDGAREVVKAQRSGESITLQEAQDRGDAAEARRESERREYFSEEATEQRDVEHQEAMEAQKKERRETFTRLGGDTIEDGFYEDQGTGLVYEIRTDPKTGRRRVLAGEIGDMRLLGMVDAADADTSTFNFAYLVNQGEAIKVSGPLKPESKIDETARKQNVEFVQDDVTKKQPTKQRQSAQQAPTVEPAANGEQKGQPESEAATSDTTSAKKPSGWVWIKEQQLPFTSWREIARGKNAGKVAVNIRGREVIVDKSKVERWPEGSAAPEKKTDQPAESVRAETDGAALGGGPASRIKDFGEKIGGARKDYASKLSDAANYDTAKDPLSKSFPEPDYNELIESGVSKKTVAFIRALRDEIPTKPRRKGYRLREYIKAVEAARDISSGLLDGSITMDAVKNHLHNLEESSVKNIIGRADLYETFGHDKSLKGIILRKHHFGLYRGEKNVTKWMVEKKGSTSAFGNMPQELGVGDTREEAIASFAKRIDSLAATDDGKRTTKFDVYRYHGQQNITVGKKTGRNYIDLKDGFKDFREARAYIKSHQAELEEKLKGAKQTPFERRTTNRERSGKDYRQGKNVTPEQFAKEFGFRGVEFGNWVENDRRQVDLNQAYDALMDLAAILKIPTQALSLNGELGLAFGARGHGGERAASAHYERPKVVINLTKKHGAGSLAHEWFHALDNYFSRMRERGAEMTSEHPYPYTDGRGNILVRKEITEAIKHVRDTLIMETDLVVRSQRLDSVRSKPYYSTTPEYMARAFENYIIEKMGKSGEINDYLANISNIEDYADDFMTALSRGLQVNGKDVTAKDVYPYLLENEVSKVTEAFNRFTDTLKTRKTDKGVQLYSGLAFLEPFINRGAKAAKAKVSNIPKISQQQRAKLKRVTGESVPDMTDKLTSIFKGATDMKGFDSHPAGQLWKEAVIRIETEANAIVGRNLSKMEKAEAALTVSDRQWAHENFKRVYEASGSAGMPTSRLKAYADAWTEVHNELGKIAEELGVMVTDDRFEGGRRPFKRSLPNFFPRAFTREARDAVKRGRGSVFEAMVEAGIERGVDVRGLIEANTTVDDMRRFGHMENPRIGELPDTVTTKNGETVKILQSNPFDMIASYINGAAHRLAIIRELGQDEAQSIAEEVSTALKTDGLHTEGRMVDDTWAVLNGNLSREERRRLEERGLLGIVRPLESIARLAMLSTATVSQISGWVPMAARGGMWNNVKAMAEVAGEKAGRRIGLDLKSTAELDLVRNMGGWAKDVLGHTYETEDLEGFADAIAKKGLSATGFSAANRILNQAASLTALNSFIDGIAYLRNPKDGALARLWGKDSKSVRNQLKANYDFTDGDLDRMVSNGIDYSDAQSIADRAATDPKMQRAYLDMAQAVQRMVGKTNLYRESVMNRPPWMNKRGARMFMTFLSYSRAMGRTLGYSMTEAKRGNLRPIVTLLAGGAIAGGVVDELKKLLFRKDNEPIEDSWDLFKRLMEYELEAATFGLWGVVAQDALWSYRLNDVSIDIPLVEWWFRNIRGVVKAIDKGDPGEIYKELARSTPIIKAIDAQTDGPLYSSRRGSSASSNRRPIKRKPIKRKTIKRKRIER